MALILAAQSALPAFAAEAAYGPAKEIENRESGQNGTSVIPATPLIPAQTVQTGESTPPSGAPVYNGDVNTLKTAAITDKLLVAVGSPEGPTKTVVSYYEKDSAGKFYQIFSVDAVCGMKGISAEKAEGDKKTPQGVYTFPMAFGMKDNPGSILPYHKVVNGDHYVDDSNSRYYNQLVNEFSVVKDWNSSENLITQAPQYNYALVMNYNETNIPGKGSAIFLHCPKITNNTGTSGCISIPEERMKELLGKVDANTKIIVVPEEAYLAFY